MAAVPDDVKVPALPTLPGREKWPAEVVAWWQRVWQSPMRAEILDAERSRIEDIAWLRLAQAKARADRDVAAMLKIAAELRQQEAKFGLTPADRRSLQVTIAQGEEAEEKTERRRNQKASAKRATVKAVPSLKDVLG